MKTLAVGGRKNIAKYLSTTFLLGVLLLMNQAFAQYIKVEPIYKYGPNSPIDGKYPSFDTEAEVASAIKASYEAAIASSGPGFRLEWLDDLSSPNENCNSAPAVMNGRSVWYCYRFKVYEGPPRRESWQIYIDSRFTASLRVYCPTGFGQSGENISVDSWGHPVEVNQFCDKVVRQSQCKQGSCAGVIGNPINVATQVKLEREVDYAPNGAGANKLRFERLYRSDYRRFLMSHQPVLVNLLGGTKSLQGCYSSVSAVYGSDGMVKIVPHCFPFVRFNYDPPYLATYGTDGHVQKFEGATLAPATNQVNDRVVTKSVVGGLRYLVFRALNNTVEEYSEDGRILAILKKSGGQTTFLYDQNSEARPVKATDQYGRSLNFTYTAAGNLSGIELPDGSRIVYQLDSMSDNCLSVACEQLAGVAYADNSRRSYNYDDIALISSAPVRGGLLTGVTDELGVRYAKFSYDGELPIGSSHIGDLSSFQVSYPMPDQATVLDPLGTARNYTFDVREQVFELTRLEVPGCADCLSQSQAMDANGNVASRDDFNGKRVCYGNDLSRNLETVRVEGLEGGSDCSAVTGSGASLPASSRKVSSQWHPDWRLEVKVAEPGLLTTSVYNGQPDPFNGNAVASCAPASALLPDGKPIAVLCKKVQQATTDANGAQGFSAALQAGVPNRQWSWTYNQWGQVLSEDGPRTDVADTTTYVYYADTTADHTMGDLQQVTNAAGRVTTYPRYNPHGQVLRQIDPNGVVTDYTYDLRQRLTSVSVGGQTTTYTYDPVGQLTRLTQPDASWVGYEYDAAHRLVATKDNLGNRIEYVLDNAGNRTGESVKDPTGVLRRQLSRSMDALGRVQQTTGRE